MRLDRWGRYFLIAFIIVLLASILTGCNSGELQNPTVIKEEANVESLTLLVIGKTPVKVHASVKGSHPNDCTLVYDINQGWNEEIYEIEILTKRPIQDDACEEGPIEFEEIYEIPVYQLVAGEYVVDVNGVQEPLVFAFDNN